MIHSKTFHYEQIFTKTSTTPNGDRFKRYGFNKLSVDKLSAKPDDADDMSILSALSDQLDTPVRWDADADQYYIEVISKEQLKKA